jgi:hypothetical protein
VTDAFHDDLPDDPPAAAWGVDGPAFGRRPAAVEPLRDELLRYLGGEDVVEAVAGAAADVEAWRGPDR